MVQEIRSGERKGVTLPVDVRVLGLQPGHSWDDLFAS